jgi:hypothetical protein
MTQGLDSINVEETLRNLCFEEIGIQTEKVKTEEKEI